MTSAKALRMYIKNIGPIDSGTESYSRCRMRVRSWMMKLRSSSGWRVFSSSRFRPGSWSKSVKSIRTTSALRAAGTRTTRPRT